MGHKTSVTGHEKSILWRVPGMTVFKRSTIVFYLLICVLLSLSSRAIAARTQTVMLPITIDYKLLQKLIVRKAYTQANQSVTLLNLGEGCVYLSLSKPSISEAQGLLKFETEVRVHAGTPLAGQCVVPIEWQGILVLYQRPVFDGSTWQLSFVTTGSKLLDMNRQPATIAGVVWDLIKERVFQYLEGIRIDLAPPVQDLKNFLLPLFPENVQEQTRKMLSTLRTDDIRVLPQAVVVEILADVQEVYSPEEVRKEEVLSGKDQEKLIRLWEQWDALLSYLVAGMSEKVLKENERRELIDVLLDTRYRFVDALSTNNFTHDFVRRQFVTSWTQLMPIFRNHLAESEDDENLGYLSFFTAADALAVLDRLGPTFGIELSRDGMVRLARMLTKDQTILEYGNRVNPALRKLFELKPTPDGMEPSDDIHRKEVTPDRGGGSGEKPSGPLEQTIKNTIPAEKDMDKNEPSRLQELRPKEEKPKRDVSTGGGEARGAQNTVCLVSNGLSARIRDFFLPSAWAGGLSQNDIFRWQVPETGVDTYIKKVIEVLDAASKTQRERGDFPVSLRDMYHSMIIAMAWQESCFRQFVEKNHQLVYLLSYNNTSVGLMQVNERVWRGLYDIQELRWNIKYNAAAGSEIAALYLRKYALRDKSVAKNLNQSTLASLVYAMYNGGPGQYRAFRKRLAKGKLLSSDVLFKEKYSWVISGQREKMSRCLKGT